MITLITGVAHFFVLTFLMLPKAGEESRSIFTLITQKLHSFVLTLYVHLQRRELCCCVTTLITWILFTKVFAFHVIPQVALVVRHMVTVITSTRVPVNLSFYHRIVFRLENRVLSSNVVLQSSLCFGDISALITGEPFI